MSGREYHELMAEICLTRAMMFVIAAALMHRDYGLCPAFACSILAAIAYLVVMIWIIRRANG